MILRLALLTSLLAAPALAADETIATGPTGAPPGAAAAPALPREAPPQPNSPQAIGAWAQDVLAGRSTATQEPQADRPRCERIEDRRPHGEVWAGVGTGGYREVGGVVTKPIGDCGQVTVAISRTESNGRRHRR